MDEAPPPVPPPPRPPFAVDDEQPMPNKKATTALGLGIAALLCVPTLTIVLAPAALVTGVLARREIDRRPGRFTNRGMATAGMVMAGLAVVITVAWVGYRRLA